MYFSTHLPPFLSSFCFSLLIAVFPRLSTSCLGLFTVSFSCSRQYQQPTADVFEVLETTCQLITNRFDLLAPQPPPPLRKEIETVTVYTRESDDRFNAVQRTATFLSNRDPRYPAAAQQDPRVADTAIDIRYYTIVYDRIQGNGRGSS